MKLLIFPKAILVGVFISLGSFFAMSLLFNVAVMIINQLVEQIQIVPVETFIDAIINNAFILWTMNIMACSVQLFSNYQCARMSVGSEFLNSFLACGVSLTVLFLLGNESKPFETVMITLIFISFAIAGTYLGQIKNRKEQMEEKL